MPPAARIFSDQFIGAAFGTAAIAAMIAPFFVGMIADRFFSTERLLFVLHVVGGVILYWLSGVLTPTVLYWGMIAYFLTYMPTLALTNSISFHHLDDPARQFPGIRVAGTIGWIVAGFLVGSLFIAGKSLFHPEQIGFRLENPFGLPQIFEFGEKLRPNSKSRRPRFRCRLPPSLKCVLGVFCLALPHTPPSRRESAIGERCARPRCTRHS